MLEENNKKMEEAKILEQKKMGDLKVQELKSKQKACVRWYSFEQEKYYQTMRSACVRTDKDKNSTFVCTLSGNTKVYVNFINSNTNRAYITKPVVGWISTITKKGNLLKKLNTQQIDTLQAPKLQKKQ